MSISERRWRGPHPRTLLIAFSCIGALAIVAVVAFAGLLFVISVFGADSAGSKKLATRWRNEMEAWESPADAIRDSTVDIHEFPNGEWVIIRAEDSHGLWHGGGTMVVKDSADGLNCYHDGHVCGDGNPLMSTEFDSLDSFYEALKESDFKEFPLETDPPQRDAE